MYMDIHEVKGATAEAVAKAHSADVMTQSKYGVEYRERAIKVRIGAAAGEPVESHQDLFGSTVPACRARSVLMRRRIRAWCRLRLPSCASERA